MSWSRRAACCRCLATARCSTRTRTCSPPTRRSPSAAGDRVTILHKGGDCRGRGAGAVRGPRRLAGAARRGRPGAARGARRCGAREPQLAPHPRPGEPGGHQPGAARRRPPADGGHGDRRAAVAAGCPAATSTLATATRFRSFPRAERRVLMLALDAVVAAAPREARRTCAAGREQWKRLGRAAAPARVPAVPAARSACSRSRGARSGSRRWRRRPRGTSAAGEPGAGGAGAGGRARHCTAVAWTGCCAMRRPPDAAAILAARGAGRAVRLGPRAAVGARALPEPRRARERACRGSSRTAPGGRG